MTELAIGALGFSPRLIIFDKDGTLIDFHSMWSAWICELAKRLATLVGPQISAQLFEAVGFNAHSRRAVPGGMLAVAPMHELRCLVTRVVKESRTTGIDAETVVRAAWFVPDASREARPLADLPCLFRALRARGIVIAVATSDDRAPAEAALAALGVGEIVSALIAADDAVRPKPAPDMALQLCDKLRVDPRYTLVVGDSVADMQMGHAAGVGCCIGVLSGVSTAEDLIGCADILLGSVADLLALERTPLCIFAISYYNSWVRRF